MDIQWTDPVPTTKKLKFTVPLHRRIRRHVYLRDDFTCQWCGLEIKPDGEYSGESTCSNGSTFLVVDHIISIRRGGTHHPDNLQVLCDRCNATKSCLLEGAGCV